MKYSDWLEGIICLSLRWQQGRSRAEERNGPRSKMQRLHHYQMGGAGGGALVMG